METVTLKPIAHDRALASIHLDGLTIDGIAVAFTCDEIRVTWPSCVTIEAAARADIEGELRDAFSAWLDLSEGVS